MHYKDANLRYSNIYLAFKEDHGNKHQPQNYV